MVQRKKPSTPGGVRAMSARQQIYDLVRAQIANGTLPPGARPPSKRALAAEVGVSRATITSIYERLTAEGYFVTASGRATRVVSALDSVAPARGERGSRSVPPLSRFGRRVAKMVDSALLDASPEAVDFLYGAVATKDFPAMGWRRAYVAALMSAPSRLYYSPPEGDASLRCALQGYLGRTRGLQCAAEQIVIVHGSQQAIDLCARVLLDEDDSFAFEDPGYPMARRCFSATGARPLPVPVDAYGLDTERLPRGGRIRLVYVTPSHQFPLGGTLSTERRQALLSWARRQRAWVIEDDYDSEFRYGQLPIDPLKAIDSEGRVIYIGTASKALSPQMRLGYLVLPPSLVGAFREAKRLTDRHAPVLEQRVLASLIDSGAYERHVRRLKRENERRRTALLEAIARWMPEATQVEGTAAGLHIVVWLPWLPASEEPTVIAAARRHGVGVHAVSGLFAGARKRPPIASAGFVVGYASLEVTEIELGVRRWSSALSDLRG